MAGFRESGAHAQRALEEAAEEEGQSPEMAEILARLERIEERLESLQNR